MTPNQEHDLLPAYVRGDLRQEDRERFERHLEECPECREEHPFLVQLAGLARSHGAALFEDHPPVEALVAWTENRLDASARGRVARHLELCAACELETRWISGDAAVELGGTAADRRTPAWRWPAALAATVALGLAFYFATRAPHSARVVVPYAVGELERSAGDTEVPLMHGAFGVSIFVPIDLPAEEFPCRVELLDGEGEPIPLTAPGDDVPGLVESSDDLVGGLYWFLDCPRTVCPPGAYSVRIESSSSGSPSVFRFRVVERTDP